MSPLLMLLHCMHRSDDMDVGDASSELSQLLDELAAMDLTKLQLEPAGFEKDQDLNFHIDFVASAR
jgi:Ubiquitin-activating enzyme active site